MASAEWGGKKPYVKCQTSPAPELCHSCPDVVLTLPRSRMKQSPVLKLSQLTGTSVARTVLLPLTCSSLCTVTSLGTTCLKPEATPPAWGQKQEQRFTPGLGEERIPLCITCPVYQKLSKAQDSLSLLIDTGNCLSMQATGLMSVTLKRSITKFK